MPMYDVICAAGHEHEVLRRVAERDTPCPTCGLPTDRVWKGASSHVLGDEINEVLDNVGPEPVHVTSRTEKRKLLRDRGLREKVRHIDGSPHTSRWI